MSALVRRLKLHVKLKRRSDPKRRYGKRATERVPRKTIGIKKSKNAKTKWTRFERIIESGMTAWGNLAFFIRLLSYTIEGVAFVRDTEKKFQMRSPVKRKK